MLSFTNGVGNMMSFLTFYRYLTTMIKLFLCYDGMFDDPTGIGDPKKLLQSVERQQRPVLAPQEGAPLARQRIITMEQALQLDSMRLHITV